MVIDDLTSTTKTIHGDDFQLQATDQRAISIVIVNWNTRDLLLQCLRSIFEGVDSPRSNYPEVIVVDNASTDGSAQAVRKTFPQVNLIENGQNVGFARANNQAITRCQGDYILLLNPDTEVAAGALHALLEFMDRHPEAGAVGPRTLNPNGTLQASAYPAPSLLRELWFLLHLDIIYPFGRYHMEGWSQDDAREVDGLLGACILLRRSALDQVGPLDEDFFMYSEEVDLCYRLREAGWHLYWIPQAEIVHYGGQSTGQVAAEMFAQLYRSKVIYFGKHHGKGKARLYKLVLYLGALPRLLLTPVTWIVPNSYLTRYRRLASNYRRLVLELHRY